MFPWDATEILARDERLVELMRAGVLRLVDEERKGEQRDATLVREGDGRPLVPGW